MLDEVESGWVGLGWVVSTVGNLFLFRFYSSHCFYRRRMRAYQYSAFSVLDAMYCTADTTPTPRVGTGRRRRFLD
jgi:hypothetical protein